MMNEIIKNQKDLDAFIEKYGDCHSESTFISVVEDGCYAIFGCTYASEAFRFVNDTTSLLITDVDYSTEIKNQINDTPFQLKTSKKQEARVLLDDMMAYLNMLYVAVPLNDDAEATEKISSLQKRYEALK